MQPGAKRRDASHSHPLIALCRLSLLRAPLESASEYGAIGLTRTKAFKRTVEHFDWPGSGAEEMFRYNKVIDEYEFPLTKRGLELVQATAQLFATLVPFYHETQRNLSESMSISGNCF